MKQMMFFPFPLALVSHHPSRPAHGRERSVLQGADPCPQCLAHLMRSLSLSPSQPPTLPLSNMHSVASNSPRCCVKCRGVVVTWVKSKSLSESLSSSDPFFLFGISSKIGGSMAGNKQTQNCQRRWVACRWLAPREEEEEFVKDLRRESIPPGSGDLKRGLWSA